MADSKKPADPSGAPKIMDVINKRSQASATSRPVIPGKKPQPDPMVKKETTTKHKVAYSSANTSTSDTESADPSMASEAEQQQDTKAPLSVHHALRLEPVDPHKVGEVFAPSSDDTATAKNDSEDQESGTADDAAKSAPAPAEGDQPATADAASEADTDQPKATEKSPAPTAKSSESPADTTEPAPDTQSEKGDSITEDKTSEDEPKSPSESDDGKQESEKSGDSIDDQTIEEVVEPVDLLRDQVHRDHGSALAILLGLIIIVILAAVAIDLAVDAGMLSFSVPHTHFFSS